MNIKALTGSLSPGDQGLSQVADVEHGWCLDIIPVLLGEWIHTARKNTRVLLGEGTLQADLYKANANIILHLLYTS